MVLEALDYCDRLAKIVLIKKPPDPSVESGAFFVVALGITPAILVVLQRLHRHEGVRGPFVLSGVCVHG